MPTIQDIYTRYTIPPRLQQHMYRVAQVGAYMSMYTKETVDTDCIITACLLHDMGNLIKFNLDLNPASHLDEEQNHYRKQVQKSFIARYGNDEKVAHRTICQEVTTDQKILHLIDSIGISKIPYHLANYDLEHRIINYADMVVSPTGIVTMHERLEDGVARYRRKHPDPIAYEQYCAERKTLAEMFQKILFQYLTIHPGEITQDNIDKLKLDMTHYTLPV